MVDQWMHFFNYHSIWLLFGAAAILIALWGLLEYFLHKNEKVYRMINIILFIVSILAMLRSTVLFRQTAYYSVSLTPFATLSRAFGDKVLSKSMLYNILLFMPLSLFGCSVFCSRGNKRAWLLIVSGSAFSVVIETLQYALSIGQTDIDDVICNTIGLITGYLIYRLHDRLFLQKKIPLSEGQ